MTELRNRMIADMKLHGLAPGTQKVYVNAVSRLAMLFNSFFIRLPFVRGLFSYQIFVRAQARPTVPNLLRQTIATSEKLREELKQKAA